MLLFVFGAPRNEEYLVTYSFGYCWILLSRRHFKEILVVVYCVLPVCTV